MDRYLWRPIYILYLGYLIAAMFGWLKSAKADMVNAAANGSRREFFVWITMIAFPLCNLLANLAATVVNVTGPHGRYLFPSELCILALIIAGLRRVKFGDSLIISLIAVNLVVTATVWFCWYMPGRG